MPPSSEKLNVPAFPLERHPSQRTHSILTKRILCVDALTPIGGPRRWDGPLLMAVATDTDHRIERAA